MWNDLTYVTLFFCLIAIQSEQFYFSIWASFKNIPALGMTAYSAIASKISKLCSSMRATVKKVPTSVITVYIAISSKLSQLYYSMLATVKNVPNFVSVACKWILANLQVPCFFISTNAEVEAFLSAFIDWINFNFRNPGYLYYVSLKLTFLAVFLGPILLLEPDVLAVLWIRLVLFGTQIFSVWRMKSFYHVDKARSNFSSHACYGWYLAITYLMFRFHFVSLDPFGLFYELLIAGIQWIAAIAISSFLIRRFNFKLEEGDNAFEKMPMVYITYLIVNQFRGSYLFDAFFFLDFIAKKSSP